MVTVPPLAAAPVVVAPPAVVAAPAAVVVAPPPLLVVPGDAVVLLVPPLLSPPHAAAIMAAPRSATAALATPAVLLKLLTSWVRDGVRGRDASGRPDNPSHQDHPHHAWGHETRLLSASPTWHLSAARSIGQYLPFDVWPSNGGAR